GVANPAGMILSAAMLLRLSLGLDEAASAVEAAVSSAVDDGVRTRDLGGNASTEAFGDAVIARLGEGRSQAPRKSRARRGAGLIRDSGEHRIVGSRTPRVGGADRGCPPVAMSADVRADSRGPTGLTAHHPSSMGAVEAPARRAVPRRMGNASFGSVISRRGAA